MPESFESRLETLGNKMRLLVKRYDLMKAQRDDALQQVDALKRQAEADRKALQDLTMQIEYLKMAANVESSAGDVEKTRAFLSELVWEINKCISQLK